MDLTLKEEYDKLDNVIKEYIKEIEQKNKTIDSLNQIIDNFKKNPKSPVKERFQSVFKPDISEFKTPEKKDIEPIQEKNEDENEDEERKNEVNEEIYIKTSPKKEDIINNNDFQIPDAKYENNKIIGINGERDNKQILSAFFENPTGAELSKYLTKKYVNLRFKSFDGIKSFSLTDKFKNWVGIKIKKRFMDIVDEKIPYNKIEQDYLQVGILYYDLCLNYEEDYIQKYIKEKYKKPLSKESLKKNALELFKHFFYNYSKESGEDINKLIEHITTQMVTGRRHDDLNTPKKKIF